MWPHMSHDDEYIDSQRTYVNFMRPSYQQAFSDIGSQIDNDAPKILDAGCGPGEQLPLFAEQFGPDAEIHAIDVREPHLEAARNKAKEAGIEDQIETCLADLNEPLPFEDGEFDLVWLSDVLFPDEIDRIGLTVRQLTDTLAPGGICAIYYGNWLRDQFLPGHADLEQRINAVRERYWEIEGTTPYAPLDHPERAPAWLHDVGLVDVSLEAYSVVHEGFDGGLPDVVRERLENAYQSYVEALQTHRRRAGYRATDQRVVSESDIERFERLFNPESEEYLPDRSDYYCTATAHVVTGRKPAP